MSMDLLERLLGHDHWTTRQFLELARSLSDQQLDRDFKLGHGTVRKTFEHVIWNVDIVPCRVESSGDGGAVGSTYPATVCWTSCWSLAGSSRAALRIQSCS